MNNLAYAYDVPRGPDQLALTSYTAVSVPTFAVPELAAERPRWVGKVVRRLVELLDLPERWDGRDAKRVQTQTAYYASTFLGAVCSPSTAEPQIVPTIAGGLQIEWHKNNVDIELELEGPYTMHLFIEYLDDGRIIDRPMQGRDADFMDALAVISA